MQSINCYHLKDKSNNAKVSFRARRISTNTICNLQNNEIVDFIRFNQHNSNDIKLFKRIFENFPSDSYFSLIEEIAEDFIKLRKFLFYGLVKCQKFKFLQPLYKRMVMY